MDQNQGHACLQPMGHVLTSPILGNNGFCGSGASPFPWDHLQCLPLSLGKAISQEPGGRGGRRGQRMARPALDSQNPV